MKYNHPSEIPTPTNMDEWRQLLSDLLEMLKEFNTLLDKDFNEQTSVSPN